MITWNADEEKYESTDKLRECTRDEFIKYVNSRKLDAKPVEGNTISAMQFLDGAGIVMAQAVYHQGGYHYYQIRGIGD